jgi:histidinol-phosphate aminotransferase
LSQKEAIASLNDVEMYTIQIEEIKSERMRLEQLFATLPWVDWVYPSDANFLLVKVDDASKRYAALLENKIVSRDRSSQLNCKNCIRISVGTVEENDKLIAVCKSLTI